MKEYEVIDLVLLVVLLCIGGLILIQLNLSMRRKYPKMDNFLQDLKAQVLNIFYTKEEVITGKVITVFKRTAKILPENDLYGQVIILDRFFIFIQEGSDKNHRIPVEKREYLTIKSLKKDNSNINVALYFKKNLFFGKHLKKIDFKLA